MPKYSSKSSIVTPMDKQIKKINNKKRWKPPKIGKTEKDILLHIYEEGMVSEKELRKALRKGYSLKQILERLKSKFMIALTSKPTRPEHEREITLGKMKVRIVSGGEKVWFLTTIGWRYVEKHLLVKEEK